MNCLKISAVLGLSLCLAGFATAQRDYSLRSPDNRIEIKIKIRAADRLKYDVLFKGQPRLQDSQLSINIDHTILGLNPKVVAAKERSSDEVL